MPEDTTNDDKAASEGSPETVAPNGGPAPEVPTPAPVADTRVPELESLVVHLKADFDNYKKRTQREMSSAMRMGELDSVKRFLPALTNLERALSAANQAGGESGPLIEGLRAVHAQFQSILQQMGVERIPAVGLPFDPTLHDAVAAGATADVIPGTVIDEYEAGYRADGKALIPAKVRVATAE
jgi:molecular chaperone GrpE